MKSDSPGTRTETDPTVTTGDAAGQVVDPRIYRALGEQFLRRPSTDRVEAVGEWVDEWRRTAPSLPPEFDAAVERIASGAEVDVETLRTDYTHLFRGVSEGAPDPPYESLYVDGQFYSGTTTEVRRGYRWAGVDIDDAGGNEPPDHLGLELQFLSELVAMDQVESDDHSVEDAQWWTLDDHLTEWLPAFHARVAREDPTEYYGGLVDLALAVVEAHHARLASRR